MNSIHSDFLKAIESGLADNITSDMVIDAYSKLTNDDRERIFAITFGKF